MRREVAGDRGRHRAVHRARDDADLAARLRGRQLRLVAPPRRARARPRRAPRCWSSWRPSRSTRAGSSAAAGRCSASAAASAGPGATGGRAAARLRRRDRLPARRRARPSRAASASAAFCACAARAPVEPADHQRRELGAAQVAELRRADVPKISGAASGIASWCSEWKNMCCERWPWVSVRSARDSSTVSRAGSRSFPRHGATSSRARSCGLPTVQRREPREVAGVVAQPPPDVPARDAEQRVQARLVVGEPVLHHPRLVRQPVRRRAGRRLGVQRLRLRLGRLRRRRRREHQQRDDHTSARIVREPTPAAGRPAPGRPRTASPCSVWLYIAAAGW